MEIYKRSCIYLGLSHFDAVPLKIASDFCCCVITLFSPRVWLFQINPEVRLLHPILYFLVVHLTCLLAQTNNTRGQRKWPYWMPKFRSYPEQQAYATSLSTRCLCFSILTAYVLSTFYYPSHYYLVPCTYKFASAIKLTFDIQKCVNHW